MTRAKAGWQRQRGVVDRLPSGALRVRVYGGTDPVSGKRNTIVEIVEPGPKQDARAEAARTRLLNQIVEQRSPRTSATLDQLLERYLETLDVGRTTHRMRTRYLEKHVRPFLGRKKAGAVGAEAFDSLYAELRRCRDHWTDRRGTDHRTSREQKCDDRCRPHSCRPLAAATIRHIHFVLNGAYSHGVRWRWVSVNPVEFVVPPAKPPPEPHPPSAEEAARILNDAWRDPDWGALVWLTMTTGARRGELCALRWSHVGLSTGTLVIRRAISQDGRIRDEKDTKTHQQRRIVMDPETVAVLTEHRERCTTRAQALGVELPADAFVFSLERDGRTHLVPGSVSQRYGRLAARLGIDTHLHNLRHYSATELIAAGVDVRTVAGRLGYSGGGVTTLRVYAAAGRTWLDVPYAEKDTAKAVGARWDPNARRWYDPRPVTQELRQWAARPELPDLLPGEDRTFKPGLFVDLIPTTSWFTNVRSCVAARDWDRVRRMVNRRAEQRCEACGAAENRAEQRWLEAHERWAYDAKLSVQSLRLLVCLCTDCHRTTHYDLSEVQGTADRAFHHLMAVNGLSAAQAKSHISDAVDLWRARSLRTWTLDLVILTCQGVEIVSS